MKLSSAALIVFSAGVFTMLHGCVDRRSPSIASIDDRSEACAIALVPHQGTGTTDLEIHRLQGRLKSQIAPIPYLEKLGWAYVALARSTFDDGFMRLADQTGQCIASIQPDASEALLLRGHVLHQLHQFEDAENLARRLVSQRGIWFDYGLLGDVLIEVGNIDEAVDAYQLMMNQKPGPQAYVRAARVRWLKGDLPGAIEMMDLAAGAIDSRNPETTAWVYVQLAGYRFQQNDDARATLLVDAALRLVPDYAPALLMRGQIRLAHSDYAAAVAALSRAAELNPLPSYQWPLIEALESAGRQDEAESLIDNLIQVGAASDPRGHSLFLATRHVDIPLAITLAREELRTRQDVFTLDALAWALHAAGQSLEARSLSRLALGEGTLDARLFLHAGVIAAAAGDTADAHQWLHEARSMERALLPSERELLSNEFATL